MFKRKRSSKTEPRKEIVSVALSESEASKLYDLCEKLGIFVSAFIRSLIIEALYGKN
jgi:hypothetical protein